MKYATLLFVFAVITGCERLHIDAKTTEVRMGNTRMWLVEIRGCHYLKTPEYMIHTADCPNHQAVHLDTIRNALDTPLFNALRVYSASQKPKRCARSGSSHSCCF